MKNVILVLFLGFIFTGFAQAESAFEICTEEAKAAGVEDQEELRAYIDECVEQVQAEINEMKEANQQEAAEES